MVNFSNWLGQKPFVASREPLYTSALQLWLRDPSFTITDPSVTNTPAHLVPSGEPAALGRPPRTGVGRGRGSHLKGPRVTELPRDDTALLHALREAAARLTPPCDDDEAGGAAEGLAAAAARVSTPDAVPRLLGLRALDEAMADGDGADALPPLPAWPDAPRWWDALCDRRLLLGLARHGFGRWGDLRADASLEWPAAASPAAASPAAASPALTSPAYAVSGAASTLR